MKRVFGVSVVGAGVDQITKAMARHVLSDSFVDMGWFRFDLVYNTGAAYGVLSEFTDVLMWIGIAVIVYLIFSIRRLVQHSLEAVAYGCILGGAIGNTLDRIWFGRVTDFINIQIIPVFNVADMLLNIGVLLIIVHYFCYGRHRR
jgi:signal peptidase II